MKSALAGHKLIKAVIALIILFYFAYRTTSPKIIFAPFVICCIASIGKNLGILFNRRKIAFVFDRLFKIVFFSVVVCVSDCCVLYCGKGW